MKRIPPHSREERGLLRQAMILAGGLLLLDQVSKVVVERTLAGRGAMVVIAGFFDLVYVTNKGAAWGLFGDLASGRWLLLLVSALVTVVVIWRFRILAEGRWERFYALAMVLSGILGNGIDRIWRGEVVDFLDFYVRNWHWPAFNIADSAICVGVTAFVISTIFHPPEKTVDAPAPPGPGKTDAA